MSIGCNSGLGVNLRFGEVDTRVERDEGDRAFFTERRAHASGLRTGSSAAHSSLHTAIWVAFHHYSQRGKQHNSKQVRSATGEVKATIPIVRVTPSEGTVFLQWRDGDLDTAGVFTGEIEISYLDSTTHTLFQELKFEVRGDY